MEENGEFRGNFKIDVGGDWTNGDNNGPCNNDCENLNITVFRGGAEVWTNQFTGIQQGEQNVPFAFAVSEEHQLWDGRDDNPIIEVTMKVKGNQQNTGPGGVFLEGDPAWFAIKLGTESRLEIPIDPVSWEENFEAGDDGMMDEMEDTPGFTLVVASAQPSAWRSSSTSDVNTTTPSNSRPPSAQAGRMCSSGLLEEHLKAHPAPTMRSVERPCDHRF